MTFTADANITDEWNENLTRLLVGAAKKKQKENYLRVPEKSLENCIKHS